MPRKLELNNLDQRTLVQVLVLGLIAILALFLFRNIIVFAVFLVISFMMNMYQSKLELEFDLTPSLVLMIIFSMKLGFFYGLIFLFMGSVVPSLISGGFNHLTIFFIIIAVVICYIASLGLTDHPVRYGLILVLVQSALGFGLVFFFLNDPTGMFAVLIGLALNILYMFILTNIIFSLLG